MHAINIVFFFNFEGFPKSRKIGYGAEDYVHSQKTMQRETSVK